MMTVFVDGDDKSDGNSTKYYRVTHHIPNTTTFHHDLCNSMESNTSPDSKPLLRNPETSTCLKLDANILSNK